MAWVTCDLVTVAMARRMLCPIVGGASTVTTPSAVVMKIIWYRPSVSQKTRSPISSTRYPDLGMAGPLAGGGTAAVTPGGQAGMTAASAVPHPSSGAAETAAATSPVDAIRFRRVRSWRFAGAPCSDVDEVIGIAFLGGMTAVSSGRDQGREEPWSPASLTPNGHVLRV